MMATRLSAKARRAIQANCEHDWFKGIASQFCMKCGKVETTAEFAAKAAQATRIVAK
jgi:hypothetical protein